MAVELRAAHIVAKSGEGVATPTGLVHLHHPGYGDDNESLLSALPTCSVTAARHALNMKWPGRVVMLSRLIGLGFSQHREHGHRRGHLHSSD